MPSNCRDAKGLLKSAIREENPVIFIESEVMYGDKEEIPDGEYTIPLGQGEVKREGSDVTLVSWSKILARVVLPSAEKLEQELGVSIEVIDPRTIKPMDYDLIVDSVKKTNRLVIVEEGWPFAGVGGQIAYELSKRAFDDLDAPVERVTQEDVPLPYAKTLEKASLPNYDKIKRALEAVLYKN